MTGHAFSHLPGITVEEREELIARRPINWDELGSSAKDLWEERQLRSIRRAQEVRIV